MCVSQLLCLPVAELAEFAMGERAVMSIIPAEDR